MAQAQIFPSLISADLMNLETIIKQLEPHCDGFHIDIMDNHFVPNLTWGPLLTNQIARISNKPLQVHLMVEKPEDMITQLKLTPKSSISFHLEATQTVTHTINLIKQAGYVPSVAINPSTPLEQLFKFLEAGLPHVLLMSVEPGFSGQKFIPASKERLKELVSYKANNNSTFIICMDGGINKGNIGNLYREGAEQFAVASALFNEKDTTQALKELYQETH